MGQAVAIGFLNMEEIIHKNLYADEDDANLNSS
jgi:hypothetical protein